MYGKIRKGFIMKARIVIAVLLLLSLAGVATAEDTEQASDKLAGKGFIRIVDVRGASDISSNVQAEGKGFETTIDIRIVIGGPVRTTPEQPSKYRISWTSNRKWLSYKKPNPDHLRRGNLFVDADADGDTTVTGIKVAVPAGKTFRLRVRPIYADKTRGHTRVVEAEAELRWDHNKGAWYLLAHGAFHQYSHLVN